MAEETKCKFCQMVIPSKATICPYCRKPVNRPSGCLLVLIISLAIFAILIVFSLLLQNNSTTTNTSKGRAESENSLPQKKGISPSKPLEIGHQWSYSEEVDKMSGKVIKMAWVQSTNYINFDFPYEGPQKATLLIRNHPRYGKDIILRIERGQFYFGLDGCDMVVRFDEQKPVTFHAIEPSTNDSTSAFISNYDRFVANLKKAKKVRIEAPFFREGNVIMEFKVEGLKW